ncbi:unnamed protein product [Amoebophrya sp. A25]|nr:unnamed protein product [Amoebophrya sp. A25]|eukprot:GSA25T00018156001.1
MSSSSSSRARIAIGAHDTEENDRKFGRWWKDYRDKRRPVLYSTIGELCRKPGIHKSLLYIWQARTRAWCDRLKDQHRKRWPQHFGLCIAFFAEFCFARPWYRKNLFELCAMLPGYGVGCRFWKKSHNRGFGGSIHASSATTKLPSGGEASFGSTISSAAALSKSKMRSPLEGQTFLMQDIRFRTRPFQGKVLGATMFAQRVVRNIMTFRSTLALRLVSLTREDSPLRNVVFKGKAFLGEASIPTQ